MATTVFIVSGTSFSIPSDCNLADSVEVIGGGGGGAAQSLVGATNASGGGGGGAYSKIVSASLTPNASVTIQVGAGGAGGASREADGVAGTDTWFNGAIFSSSNVGAKGGGFGISGSATAAAGGASGSGIGSTKFSGGDGGGGNSSDNGATGGGGAAGPGGAGKNAGTATARGGSGGGGNGGGSAAANNTSNNGAAGGAAVDSTAGGAGGIASGPGNPGGVGSNGSGGGGGGGGVGSNQAGGIGGAGGDGIDFDATHGSGGGGGGGGGRQTATAAAGSGGAGGLYGGGGGGGAWGDSPGLGGDGAQGIIVLIYTPTAGITFDAASNSGYQTAQSTYSWSHTCTGANRYLTVGISMLSVGGSSVSGITYNSVPLVFVRSQASVSGAVRAEWWGLVAPSTGSNTIAVTLSASLDSIGGAVSFNGVQQTSPIEGANSATATNVGAADATVNVVTVADNDWVLDVVATSDTAITVGAGQTSRNNVSGTLGSGAMSTEGPQTPPGTVTMSWTNVGAAATWSIVAVALRPIAAPNLGGASGATMLMMGI